MGKKKKQKQIQVSLSENKKIESTLFQDGSRSVRQLFAPSSIQYTSEHELKIENNYVRSFVVNGYPSRVYIGWMDNLYSYRGDMDTAVHIEPSNERTALDELTEKITQYEAQYQTEMEKGSIKNISSLESKIKALYEQRSKLEQNFESMFHVSTSAAMYHKDLKMLNKEAQKFQSRANGLKLGVMPLTLRQDDGFKSTSPFGVNFVGDYFRNMNTGALSTMFPFYNSEASHPNGTFVGINKTSNTPIFINFFDRKKFGNANMFISGMSGFGKTYLTSLITMRSTIDGIKSVIIDPEDEYQKCVDAVHGLTLDIAPNSALCLNPLDIEEEIEVDNDGNPTGRVFVDIKGKISEILNLFGVMFPGMIDSESKAEIAKCLTQMYADYEITEDPESIYENKITFDENTGKYFEGKVHKTMPRLSVAREYITQRAREKENSRLYSIANAMSLYTKGGIYDLFDCETNIDSYSFENIPVIRFNIKGIEDDVLRPIGMHIVMTWCMNRFIKKDIKTRKRLVCDEAWMMLQRTMAGSDYTALFLENCARRIRKYNGSLCCTSQNFREFVSREEGLNILSNSIVKIFLKQSEDDIDACGSRFKMSSGEREFLLSARRGEALIRMDRESYIAGIFAFPFEDKLISKNYLTATE